MMKDDEFETISILDTDTNSETEMIVIDTVECQGFKYLLVIEADLFDEDEAEASILKEMHEKGDDVFYEPIADDSEFNMIAAMFKSSDDDYTIEL